MRGPRRGWNPGRGAAVGLVVLLGAAPAVGQTEREWEDEFWRSVDCGREVEVRAYLKAYPNGAYVSEAWACLEQGLELTRAERIRVQEGLQAAGQEPGLADGLFGGPGAQTREALRAWQRGKGLAATGYLTREQAETLVALGEAAEDTRRAAVAQVAEEEASRREEETYQVGRTFRDVLRSGGEGPAMVVVPAGSFQMGSLADEEGRDDDEGPVHRVTIGEAFAAGVHEVTRVEYERFAEATGYAAGKGCYTLKGGQWEEQAERNWRDPGYRQSGEHPVVCVSWEDAQAYVGWLSRESRAEYQLLSEAEWEYVARGGTETAWYWEEGEGGQCRHANGADANTEFDWKIACNDGHARTAPVGSYTKNRFGLSDVLGNVWEWVEDCWNGSYAGAPADGTAWKQGNCNRRVLRGGSWNSNPRNLRSADRGRSPAGDRSLQRRMPCCPESNPVSLYFLTFRGFQGGPCPPWSGIAAVGRRGEGRNLVFG